MLEIRSPGEQRAVALDADRLTVGKASTNDVAISKDGQVSRLHAVLERYEAGWSIRDLGSRNGTFVNGRRIWETKVLRSGDEIRVGGTTLVFTAGAEGSDTGSTETSMARPDLTRRERDVLLALCRPVLTGDVFTEPASIREIGRELGVTDAAVKQHLIHLYDKFGLYSSDERRRVRLANEAVHRGAVTLGDLRDAPDARLPEG